MGRTYDLIDDALAEWIGRQPMYFVGTAPLAADGHVNVSPKGGAGTFRVLGPHAVAYLDLTGSGAETVAHLRENGRIVVMFCAFEGAPRIVRLHGRGRIVQIGDPEWAALLTAFDPAPPLRATLRSFVTVEVTRIADSCGYAVPRLDYVGERDQLFRWADRRRDLDGPKWQRRYVAAKNAVSLDGLAGVDPDRLLGTPAGPVGGDEG